MPKEVKLIKTLWGTDEPISPKLLQSIREEGYDGIEIIRLAWLFNRELLVESLNQAGLALVCQIHTSGGYLEDDEYIYCGAYGVKAHKEDFQKQLKECQDLLQLVNHGGFVNVHAGVDAWSREEALEFLEFSLQHVQDVAPHLTVTFETHRQRLFGNPFQARDLLSSNSLANLQLNADLSHWYCACERVFNPKDERDQWWPELVETLARHCAYIHARLGWSQGPQLADPSAKECQTERELQVAVWKTLLSKSECNFVCPEYGPPPYMPVLPHSQEPVAVLSSAVSYTKSILQDISAELA